MAELKKCPFCGGEAHERTAYPVDESGLEMNMYIVGCKNCDIEFSWLWNKECAVELWNNRPTESEIRAKAIDEFAEKMKKIGIQNNYHCSDCACEFCDGKCEPCERGFEKEIDEIAEQLKECE